MKGIVLAGGAGTEFKTKVFFFTLAEISYRFDLSGKWCLVCDVTRDKL